MDVTISLSREALTFYGQNENGTGYGGSRSLTKAFVERGHTLSIIDPSQVFLDSGRAHVKSLSHVSKDGEFYTHNEGAPLSGDVFFVYNLGEERTPEESKFFLNSLFTIEEQYSLILNSAESTSYEDKSKQKTLDLSWIPGFNVTSKSDLERLISDGEKIIAKPVIGAASRGIVFLDSHGDVSEFKGSIKDYVYERFVSADEERRYIFLDDQLIIRRKAEKYGPPGKERFLNIDLFEGDEKEAEIARELVDKLGMFFCAIDFRGDYLLEINGSGTGTMPPTIPNKSEIYDLSDLIVQAVERRFENGSK